MTVKNWKTPVTTARPAPRTPPKTWLMNPLSVTRFLNSSEILSTTP